MKRSVKIILCTVLFVCAFGVSVWHYLPWQEVGTFGVSVMSSRLRSQGTRLTWSDVTGLDDGFTVHNLSLNGGFSVSFSSVSVRPRVLSSLLSLGAVSSIAFSSGTVRLGTSIELGSGSALVTYSGGVIMLSDLRIDGPLSVRGWLAVSPSEGRITRADAEVTPSEEWEDRMSLLSTFLPLVQDGSRWVIRRQ